MPFDHLDTRFDLRVVLPQGFPWQRPRVYCPEKFEFGEYPHIEKDGAFCLYPSGTEHDPKNPRGLVWDAIKEATRLVVASFDDAFLDGFTTEFAAYWGRSEGGIQLVSLLSPGGRSRAVTLWRSSSRCYLADNERSLKRWLRNRFADDTEDLEFNTATHVVLKRLIRPTEYPKSGAAVLRIVKSLAPGAVDLLLSAAEQAERTFIVSFEGPTDDGPVFFAVEVKPPTRQGMPIERQPDMLQKGFRPGRVPPHVRLQRQLGGNAVGRHDVLRADASWIHGRDNPKVSPLFAKRVLMIGAGSLGSEVAQLLAKSGIGAISIIDPEILDFANVGRHALGVSEVGSWKAKALAERLRRGYPHMRSLEHFEEQWQDLHDRQPDFFHNVDLIVSTAGSWLVEGRLNQVAREDSNFPPVLYGWAEPFAVAGHAVLINQNGPCLSCGMDQLGRALRPVYEWDGDTTRKQAHCGVSFQPYGPISLAGVSTLVAKTTAKALLGEVEPGTEAVCWASEAEALEHEGRFSASFLKEFPKAPRFGGSRTFQWRQKDGCSFCGEE